MGIVVQASMDSMGSIIVRPVSDRWAKKFRDAVIVNGGPNAHSVYFQEGDPASVFLENDVPPSRRKELEEGYSIRWIVDPWVVGHWYGYDAHETVKG